MFQRFHAMKERREGGFTLIELLVVILIIAILAAIAIPVFLNQRKKGWVAQQQSTLKDAALALETYGTENNGDYTGLNAKTHADLVTYGFNQSAGITLKIGGDASGFCIQATHPQLAGDVWKVASYDSDDGTPVATDNCTPAVT